MRRLRLRDIGLVAGLVVAGTSPVAAGGDTASNAPARLEVTDDGPIFVTPSGRSLYFFGADDNTPGKSQCTNVAVKDMRDPTAGLGKFPLAGYQYVKSCTDMWPAFLADAGAMPSGEWSLIDRPEGGKQWAYRGRPLYMSIKDKRFGDRNGVMGGGDFFGGRRGWRLASPPLGLPPGLKLSREADTIVLATANGRPVYTPRRGKRVLEASSRSGSLFQPVAAALVMTLGGDWTVIQAGAGLRQFAYKGKPLYAAPDNLTNDEIDASGNWEKIVYRKMAPKPSEIDTRFTLVGDVYTDRNGRTLYIHNCTPTGCDEPGGPAAIWAAFCGSGEECARRWQPYRASANAKPSGEWSIVEVPTIMFKDPAGTTYPPDVPRLKAWAFRGRPVYTYYEDKEPGDAWGHQIRWFGIGSFSAVQVPGRGVYE